MHIPDGYLSPATCAIAGAAMVPVVGTACARTKRVVNDRHAPLLALGAAYSFMVMIFNVPIPGGTTAHAVGAVLIAVLLGPWAAVICVSVALVIQALFFGDGGILALGANAFNMAFAMPFAGYGVYLLLTRNTSLTARRRALAAGVGSYIGLNVAALCAAIEFGLQPVLFHSTNGTPLYAPFHLAQTIPAMALAHLTVAGAAEFVLTFGIVGYLQRANLPLLRINHPVIVDSDEELVSRSGRPALRWALIGIATMIVLSPLGLLAPGGAYGEDAPIDLNLHKYSLHAIPSGLQHYNGFWKHTLLSDYGFSSGSHAYLGYGLSVIVGALAVGVAFFLFIGSVRLVARWRPSTQTG
ncbi:MAG: cobalt transporter CbiM [Gaiellaceae bacterium]|jgi:cobalt/nickel transport system permease protein